MCTDISIKSDIRKEKGKICNRRRMLLRKECERDGKIMYTKCLCYIDIW